MVKQRQKNDEHKCEYHAHRPFNLFSIDSMINRKLNKENKNRTKMKTNSNPFATWQISSTKNYIYTE